MAWRVLLACSVVWFIHGWGIGCFCSLCGLGCLLCALVLGAGVEWWFERRFPN